MVGNNANQNDCGYNDVGVFGDVIFCNGANVVQIYPGFTDPAAGDFRLATNSPLLDLGCNAVQCTGIPDIDLNGIARPQGAGWEMGAYEGGYGFADPILADDFD